MSSGRSSDFSVEPERRSTARRGRMFGASVVVAMAVYAGFASGTQPFTWGAELACAIAFGLAALVILARSRPRLRERVLRLGTPYEGMRGEGDVPPSASRQDDLQTGRAAAGSLWPWVWVFGVLIVWEIVTYLAGFGGHRGEYPTLSSLYDEATRWRGMKAFLFFVWLALGWGLFRR